MGRHSWMRWRQWEQIHGPRPCNRSLQCSPLCAQVFPHEPLNSDGPRNSFSQKCRSLVLRSRTYTSRAAQILPVQLTDRRRRPRLLLHRLPYLSPPYPCLPLRSRPAGIKGKISRRERWFERYNFRPGSAAGVVYNNTHFPEQQHLILPHRRKRRKPARYDQNCNR